MFITKENVKEHTDLWVRRGTINEQQGQIIVAAVFADFDIYVGPTVIPESQNQKIKMPIILKIELK